MPVSLSSNAQTGEIVQAVNYLLGTQAGINTVVINTQTGAIFNPYTQQNVGYAYQYAWVAYGTDNTGSNFSFSPTNATYYGVRNTNSTVQSTNPADYTWGLATPAFGTTNFLYYTVIGGRQIQFTVASSAPDVTSVLVPTGAAINLDLVTSVGGATTAITVTGNAQPNITSVGILNSLSVSGNTRSGNLSVVGAVRSSNISVSGNVIVGNWIIHETSAGNLIFANSTANLMSLSPTGNLVISGVVVSNGTPI